MDNFSNKSPIETTAEFLVDAYFGGCSEHMIKAHMEMLQKQIIEHNRKAWNNKVDIASLPGSDDTWRSCHNNLARKINQIIDKLEEIDGSKEL